MRSIRVAATLPISPRAGAKIGFFSAPLLADVFSRLTCIRALHPVNILGSKACAGSELDHYSVLEALGLNPELRWSDLELVQSGRLQKSIERLYSSGEITPESQEIWVCPCGRTELVDSLSNTGKRKERKNYSMLGDVPFCDLCRQKARLITADVLMLQLPTTLPIVSVFPSYARAEWVLLAESFAGLKICISRMRETGIQSTINGTNYNVDVDFCWMSMLDDLERKGIQIEVLVVGHKTLKHALLSLLYPGITGQNKARTVVAAPYVSVKSGDKDFSDLASDVIANHAPDAIRFLLAHQFGSNRKDITLDSKLLYWIEHSIVIPSDWLDGSDDLILDPGVLWKNMNHQKVQAILAALRRGLPKQLSNPEKKFVRVILQYP
jgi:hypothetical protein